MKVDENLVDKLDHVLPQTQCGLCTYGACRPYAEAMAENKATIDMCPPGGITTLQALAALLNVDSSPYESAVAAKTRLPSVAVIREAECIGCTKCIQACPVDAIIGTAKKMYTVLTQDCTGCELCIEPCPVDCIDLIVQQPFPLEIREEKAHHWRNRYQRHLDRPVNSTRFKKTATPNQPTLETTIQSRQQAILDAMERAKVKRKTNEREKTS